MWKYYVLLFAVLGLGLYYVYVSDPCRSQIRAEFSAQHPGYEILGSEAESGSPESVRCRISYKQPEDGRTQEELWLYLNSDTGWKFSKVLPAPKGDPTDGAHDQRLGQQ